MRAFAFVCILFAVLVAIVVAPEVRMAKADHAGPWLPVYGQTGQDITALPAQRRALERGWVTYCFDSVAAAYPSFKTQAMQTVEAAYAMHGINAVEVAWGSDPTASEVCDVRHTMPPDATFLNTCGQGAAACIQYWAPQVNIFYRRSLGFWDWRSTFCHEGAPNSGHFMGLHEHYNDREFKSNGRSWTCMDFGTFVWQTTAYDRDRIWNAWVPDRPAAATLTVESNGWATVSWSQLRADAGAAHMNGIPGNTNATRIAFGWSANRDAPIEWAGIRCGPAFNYCFTAYRDGKRGFDPAWAGCLWGRAEAPATYKLPQFTRGDSPDGYWFLFGCW